MMILLILLKTGYLSASKVILSLQQVPTVKFGHQTEMVMIWTSDGDADLADDELYQLVR